MKVKVEIIIEISKEMQDYEIESHLKDALTGYEGNELEFWDCEIKKCRPTLKKFEQEHSGIMLECIETFEATHTNSIGGKTETNKKKFVSGIRYLAESWRPEGICIGGIFVFNKNASKFTTL